jgi:alpha-mannosidase
VSTPAVQIAAFRKKPEGGYELRLVEAEGRRTEATVEVRLPITRAARTDLIGNRLADVPVRNGRLEVAVDPWKILTFHLE